jgi:hypothetical protein
LPGNLHLSSYCISFPAIPSHQWHIRTCLVSVFSLRLFLRSSFLLFSSSLASPIQSFQIINILPAGFPLVLFHQGQIWIFTQIWNLRIINL